MQTNIRHFFTLTSSLFFLCLTGCTIIGTKYDLVDQPISRPEILGTWLCDKNTINNSSTEYEITRAPEASTYNLKIINSNNSSEKNENWGTFQLFMPFSQNKNKVYLMAKHKTGTYLLGIGVYSSSKELFLYGWPDKQKFLKSAAPNEKVATMLAIIGIGAKAPIEYELKNPSENDSDIIITSPPEQARAWLRSVDESIFKYDKRYRCIR